MAVVHHEVGGDLKPEYLSDGFAEMLDMPKEDAWNMYEKNALSGVHPDDREYVRQMLDQCIKENREKYELQYRLRKQDGSYLWISAKFSVIQCDGGNARVYVDYHDITAEKKMPERAGIDDRSGASRLPDDAGSSQFTHESYLPDRSLVW